MDRLQNVPLTRRTYNKWVANETLEDFALRFTAKRARRWSVSRIANTALGTVSFLVLEAVGGTITLSYGFTNALYAIFVVCALLFLTGIPVTYYAARYGVDIDLLTRGAGFGYIGSTISSLIYASFTFIFFALEAAIMSMALHLLFDLPLPVTYIISSLIVIPLVTHGVSMISRFQVWTQPIWIILQILPLIFIVQHEQSALIDWLEYPGEGTNRNNSFDLLLFGGACAVLFSMVAQIGEQVDFLRFLPEKKPENKLRWWLALITAGPGWVLFGIVKLLIGSFLAYLALTKGVEATLAVDPTHMYQVAFNYVTNSPVLALWLAAIFVIVCQLKINVANAYAGSLAWSNFFSRITHYHPGRVVWVVFNVLIALLLMELGVYQALKQILQTYSALVLAWIGAIVADLIINKPLGLSPKHIEFKRSHLFDINPVGVGSMALASLTGILAHLGFMGDLAQALSPFIALFLPFITVPLFAVITKSKYYLTDHGTVSQKKDSSSDSLKKCTICENEFDVEDMTRCPAYSGPICSLCCSLDSRCNDQCRPNARFSQQLSSLLTSLLPNSLREKINPTLQHFIIVFMSITTVVAGLLALIYYQLNFNSSADQTFTFELLLKIFFLLLIVLGVLTWLYVLSQQSRHDALAESQQQAKLLIKEIAAHEVTSRELQEAKNTAESANQAKSRYLTGISHELRTPLNVMMGYAQILEKKKDIPAQHRKPLQLIHRNSEHLAELIEGLLEISKIEAGRLEVQQDVIRLHTLLEQIVSMFEQQALNKGLEFHYHYSENLPEFVLVDVKRLRQILFNLLSNAIKFTQKGSVTFDIKYRNQVAQFIVKDTGIGIPRDKQELIFEPFERIRNKQTQQVSGTGIGLSISRLLTDLMGGEISIYSKPDEGSTFILSLHLPKVNQNIIPGIDSDKEITGYIGERKTIMIVDDDNHHRQLLSDFLQPLGFNIIEANHADTCINLIQENHIDLFILDVSMPDVDGWELASTLRNKGKHEPIIMISASHREPHHQQLSKDLSLKNLIKPIALDQLLEKLNVSLALTWEYQAESELQEKSDTQQYSLSQEEIEKLRSLAEIGYLDALTQNIQTLYKNNEIDKAYFEQLNVQLAACNFNELIRLLEKGKT